MTDDDARKIADAVVVKLVRETESMSVEMKTLRDEVERLEKDNRFLQSDRNIVLVRCASFLQKRGIDSYEIKRLLREREDGE